MSKFDFTKDEYQYIIDKCMFNEELAQILEYRIKNYSITKICMLMNMSESSINRRIREIKKKVKKVI